MGSAINTIPEMNWGYTYFKNHVMPVGFDYRARRKEMSPYFEKYGFAASMMYDNYYSMMNGIHSDKYIPMDVYYFYVLPCLNKHEFMSAYTDKNAYESIFAGFRQPETVVKCINGNFYGGGLVSISYRDAVEMACSVKDRCIIKPTLDTCNGDGVSLFDSSSAEKVEEQFAAYETDFIVQKAVVQHPEMAKLNKSSLNTLRVHTYRALDGKVRYLRNGTFLRFGGAGGVKDNISAGGWAARVSDEGLVDDSLYRFKSLDRGCLADECGVGSMAVPNFEQVIPFVEALHSRLPYFDLAGWDVAISQNGEPIFIEFNAQPDVEIPQSLHGPMFGDYEDEIIERTSKVKREKVIFSRRVWPNGFDHKLRIG